jgi:hypothetical protein
MPRYLIIPFSFLTLVFAASAFAADKPSGNNTAARAAGLTCFTVEPQSDEHTTCDALCEAKGGICTGVTSSTNPPPSCESGAAKNLISCRCCVVSR